MKSKVDVVGNDDVENTPKKKMKRSKKDIASPISKGICSLYPRKLASIVKQRKKEGNVSAGITKNCIGKPIA